MRMHYLQHVSFETPANIETYFTEKGYSIRGTHLYKGEALPDLSSLDVLVVMGGPMGVGDTGDYPWLAEELSLIRKAIGSGKKVVGICLGAQLIAAALGAAVYPGPYKEIGWMPIYPTEDAGLPSGEGIHVFHWHGDTFDLPQGAQLIFTSQPGIRQGYRIGSQVLALQCHLEMTAASVAAISKACGYELVADTYVQTEEAVLSEQGYFDSNRDLLYRLLDRLCDQGWD